MYHQDNRLIQVKIGNTVTGFAYDKHDNLTGVTDARSNATAYSYDDFGRTVSVTSPDSGLTAYTNDAAGNVISKTDCNGITVAYQYDAANRLTAIVYPDSSQNVTFVYDAGTYGKGHLTSVSDASGQTTYAYNAAGQMISETRTAGGHSFTTQYGYDSVSGDLVSMTYPGGMVLTYQRDANGQIAGISADGQAVVSGVGYLPFGPAKNKTLGGLTVSETFDERYQLSRIQAGTVADYQYVRDAAGNITSQTGSEIPVITTADAGNTPYSYTANRLVSTAGRSYVYDSAGNILSDGIRTFAYNQDNRLIRVSIGGNVVGEYAYDAFGRRVKKVASGVTTLYHYAGGNLIAETDENGISQRDYIYLSGQPVAVRIYGAQFGTMYYFLNDHLGTPQKILDSTNQVVWAAAYLPFGKAQVKPETITNNLRFPGQYFDAESGLHYNFHRYYDPETGRYLTPDLIGLRGGINLYIYVLNNPMRRIDIRGLFCGSGWSEYVVPDKPLADFSMCCRLHDDCYEGTDNRCDVEKPQCDIQFRECMRAACMQWDNRNPSPPIPFRPYVPNSSERDDSNDSPPTLSGCLNTAETYYYFVDNFGDSAFRNSRLNPPCQRLPR